MSALTPEAERIPKRDDIALPGIQHRQDQVRVFDRHHPTPRTDKQLVISCANKDLLHLTWAFLPAASLRHTDTMLISAM